MNCQKCRQPLELDGSLETLNPAAYDLLVSSSSPPTASKKPPLSRSSPLQQTDAKSQSAYKQASHHASAPIFKRQSAGNPLDGAMSFIFLDQSQMGQSVLQPKERTTSTPRLRKSDSVERPQGTEIPTADDMDRMNRLFEILSARSDIDHPVCVECTEMLVDGMQKKLEATLRERDSYVQHLKTVQADVATAADRKTQQAARNAAEKEKEKAMADLRRLESEKHKLDAEILALEEESRQLDQEEQEFWRERNAFVGEVADFQAERDSVQTKYTNDSELLRTLSRSNVYNDTFFISHDNIFATINGLRLGRLSAHPVDWPEINAAWGHALLLLVTVADKLGYKFEGYEPQPMGSTSKIIRYETPSPSSSRLGSARTAPPPKKHILELYSSGDLPLGLTFMHRKFDNAMVAFLELVRQLVQFVQDHPVDSRPLIVPHTIDGDKIGNPKDGIVSIKLGIAQDDGWTRACKFTLTCCKWLLAHVSNVSLPARS